MAEAPAATSAAALIAAVAAAVEPNAGMHDAEEEKISSSTTATA